jgi:hypothetical protein
LDATPDDVVKLWEAYYQLEPWGGEYQRHAVEMELMDASFALAANRGLPPNRNDLKYQPRRRKQFFPPDYAGEVPVEKKRPKMIEQCEHFANTILGRKK